jgi:hypothetical protein
MVKKPSWLIVPGMLAALFFGPILLQLAIFVPYVLFCDWTGIPYWLPFGVLILAMLFAPTRRDDAPIQIYHRSDDGKEQYVTTI